MLSTIPVKADSVLFFTFHLYSLSVVVSLKGLPAEHDFEVLDKISAETIEKQISDQGHEVARARFPVVAGETITPYRDMALRSYVKSGVKDETGVHLTPAMLQTGLELVITRNDRNHDYTYSWRYTKLVGPHNGFTETLENGVRVQTPQILVREGAGSGIVGDDHVILERHDGRVAVIAWE